MYRKHGPDHVVLISQVWPLIPLNDPDFLEWKMLGNEPLEQGEPELDISADLERAEIVNEAFDLVMARLHSEPAPATPPLPYPDEAEPEAPQPEPVPYVPDFTLIPEPLAKYAEADETAEDFRKRLKSLWQRFGIADGQNFPGGGEPLTASEKILMREVDILLNSEEGRNAELLRWLDAD